MNKNLLYNPIFIFIFFIFTAIVSTLSSVYFISIMLCGVQFLAFRETLKNKFYYSLFFVILSFLFIEFNNGFKPFSLILLAFFCNIFIIPYLKRVLSFNNLNPYIYMICFYMGMILIWSFTNDISIRVIGTILINVFIDFIIFGVFI